MNGQGIALQARGRLNWYLAGSSIAAALGGLLFGFDTAVIAGATHALTALFHLSPASLGVTVASALWGTIFGAMFGGVPADRYGRRRVLCCSIARIPI